ncbi:chaperone NapD [Campylobacter jejuni]|nr:chaperone NapD [Campylobacter jejuni]
MNNLSSVLILAKEEYINDLKKKAISEIPFCSVELCENEKIIVVIESENLEDELNSYKMLEKLPNIISINMVFSYQDLNDDIQKAINSGAIETIEKNENAENVRYYGSVFNQFS